MIVPTRSKGMQPLTLCVKFASWNAERPLRHSHAERGNDQNQKIAAFGSSYIWISGLAVFLGLFADAFFLSAGFRGEFGAEVFGRKYLADFNFRIARHRVRAALDPFDGFFF